jgi:phage terminase small subunit
VAFIKGPLDPYRVRRREGLTKLNSYIQPKIYRLIDHYMISFQVPVAARAAGISLNTAIRHLKRPIVQAEIEKRKAEERERLKMTSEEVLQELAKIGRANVASFIDDKGEVLQPSKWPKDYARAVSKFSSKTHKTKTGSTTTREICLHDKMRALETLSKHLGLTDSKNQQTTNMLLVNLPMDQLLSMAKEAMTVLDATVVEPKKLAAAVEDAEIVSETVKEVKDEP